MLIYFESGTGLRRALVKVGDLVTIYDRCEYTDDDVYGIVIGFEKDNKSYVKVLTLGRIVTIMDFDLDIISPAKINLNR